MYNVRVRYFTLKEAEARIPELEKIFAAALEIKAAAEAKVAAIGPLEQSASDPAQLAIEHAQLEFLAGSLDEALKAVETMGASLKGLDPGLVDFPHKMGNDEVYLCWKYGEKIIRYYHSYEEGFTGRKPIPSQLLHH